MSAQPQTFLGTRGETEIKGISFKDMYELVLARIEYFHPDKCDPDAFCQNICCEIEKKMGIYPNVPKLIDNSGGGA